MNRHFACLLIVVLTLPSLLKVGILVNYVVLYDRYVTELCENRDRPAMQCNGQCALTKELNSVEATENSAEAPEIPSELRAEITFLVEDSFDQLHFGAEDADISTGFEVTHFLGLSAEVSVPPPELFC